MLDDNTQSEDNGQEAPNNFTGFVEQLANAVRSEIQKVVIGQDNTINLIIAAALANGHVLLEGVPGVAKTMVARLFARVIDVDYSRIQFTPDLMPADLLGTNFYNNKEAKFQFQPGPIFSQTILIDEINRAPAKTQAALFEVMQEGQVTTDGVSRALEEPYLIIATQNPVEQEGTYRLPEAQLDRFLFKIKVDYPQLEAEIAILKRFSTDFNQELEHDVKAVATGSDVLKARKIIENVHIEDKLINYIAQLTVATRQDPGLYLAASPRASLSLLQGAKAIAAINGRNYVIPEDIRALSIPVLKHRLILSPEREMEGVSLDTVIMQLIDNTPIPR